MKPDIVAYFDEPTFTVTYLLSDPATKQAAVIDPVLDYDHKSGKVSAHSAQRIIDEARAGGLQVAWVLETHVHADHLTAAQYLKTKTGAKVAVGANVGAVQAVFKPIFNDAEVSTDGREFDCLLEDGQRIEVGALEVEVLHTPGHTPACVSYKAGDAVFVGDTLFMPDYGTARTDFPGGDARQLYRSIRRLLSLPPQTRLFMCHDYKAPGRDRYAWETTVAKERCDNIHIHDGIGETDYAAMRTRRDATLAAPVLLLPSVQFNMRAGNFPEPEGNGARYLKIPLSLGDDLKRAVD